LWIFNPAILCPKVSAMLHTIDCLCPSLLDNFSPYPAVFFSKVYISCPCFFRYFAISGLTLFPDASGLWRVFAPCFSFSFLQVNSPRGFFSPLPHFERLSLGLLFSPYVSLNLGVLSSPSPPILRFVFQSGVPPLRLEWYRIFF